MGTFFDANEEEGKQGFDEDSRPVSQPVLVEEDKDELTTANPEDETPCHVPIKDAVLSKMKVADLQEELNKRKDLTAGLKSVLLARMKEALGKEDLVHYESTTTTENKSSSSKKTTGVYIIEENSW